MRTKGLRRRRLPETVEDVRDEVRRIAGRYERSGKGDISAFRDELDSLVGTISELRPEWTTVPCVYRVARLETGDGIVLVEDNALLPDVKHTYELAIEMLNHIRTQKSLPAVTMPLFLQPDEIALDLRPVEPAQALAALPEKELKAISPRRQRRLLRRQDWTETRMATLDRDDWECRRCGALKDLHLYRVDETRDLYDPAGYVSLCRRCLPSELGRMTFRSPGGRPLEPRDVGRIRSQLALMFQRGSIERVGIVVGEEYAVLEG